MIVDSGDDKLEWKVNVITGGNVQTKSALPKGKAIRRLLKILDSIDDSVFEQFIQFKKQRANQKESSSQKKVIDPLQLVKLTAINQIKDKIKEFEKQIESIKDSIKDKVESAQDFIDQLVKKIKQKILDLGDILDAIDALKPSNKNKTFENWGETVKTSYRKILYPTDSPLEVQIKVIKDFVKQNSDKNMRTRGSGIRHSWGNIFSDPNNYLVSFYPYEVATGTSWELQDYATKMIDIEKQIGPQGVEHLGMIRKVGEHTITDSQGKQVKKHLIKIGAGVSNDQMRRWCIENNFQYKSNVIMVEVNVCGGIGTCSHGAGINTETLSDYLYEVQFIDYKGNVQVINKKDNPTLILSAASSMGLLGPMVFVTIEMEPLDIVQFQPRQSYKDFVIPTPKNYAKLQQRKKRPEYYQWLENHDAQPNQQDWEQNFRKFKQAVHKTYCEWFYFPVQKIDVFENCWDVFAVKNAENLEKIRQVNPKGRFIDVYPPPAISLLSQFSLFIGGLFINHLDQGRVNDFMKYPFAFFPNENVYLNYVDAVHFQRGIQNMRVRDFQVEINIPLIETEGKLDLDYDLIQRLWWGALQIAEDNAEIINIALEMRIFKGSKATLAPEFGYDYVCSIQILRSLNLDSDQQDLWRQMVLRVFNVWKNTLDSKGNKVTIRPHWGKEWDMYPQVKQHTFNDQALLGQVRKFIQDYEQIAQAKGFDKDKNLSAFSNQIYRELIAKATGQQIK